MSATLFLHTEEIEEATRAKMVKAGYLPIKVADLTAYRTISHSLSMSQDKLDAIGAAALQAVAIHGGPVTQACFVKYLGQHLGYIIK